MILHSLYTNLRKQFIKEFWRYPYRLRALKIAIAMLTLILPFMLLKMPYIGMTLSLGAVAASLSQTDDHPKGSLRTFFISIIIFAISTCAVNLLHPYPILFGIGFIGSTILFVLIGGINSHLKALSYGAILIGIYAMIAYSPKYDWYVQPILLCAGAAYYFIISIVLLFNKPFRSIDEQMSNAYSALAQYLEIKSLQFSASNDEKAQIGNNLSQINVEVVNSLSRCKEVLEIYAEAIPNTHELNVYYDRYLQLQSLHERASSSHEDIDTLLDDKQFAIILEGFAELLHQLSHACKIIAETTLTKQEYKHPVAISWIIDAIDHKIKELPEDDRQSVSLLLHNLSRSHQALSNISFPNVLNKEQIKINRDKPKAIDKIKEQLSFKHPRMRYALRLSFCFAIGYLINILFNIDKGEWIMMTSLFVCQPTYRETQSRLLKRMTGTILGVVLGVFVIALLPTTLGQTLIVVASVYLFLLYVKVNYSIGVIFITVYVLCINNLISNTGVEILVPRIIDTAIGAGLAFISVVALWPNWQYKQVPKLLAHALSSNDAYFKYIVNEMHKEDAEGVTGKYVEQMQSAHKADNELNLAWQSMRVEPKKHKLSEHAFTLTYLNHALLAYLSALGEQRDNTVVKDVFFDRVALQIDSSLKDASRLLNENHNCELNKNELKSSLIELKDRINSIKPSEERKQLRLLYNVGTACNNILNVAKEIKR